jgi:membrane protein DedA with SNARE-associated domain
MVLNFIAAGVWACTFAGAGYLFGAAFQHLIKDVELAFKVGILCLFVLVIGLSVFMHRKAKKQAARLQAEGGPTPPGT